MSGAAAASSGAAYGAAAAGAAVSSLIDFGASSILANSANAKSKRAAERQLWQNVYLMNLQNEYNKPINQMRRLEEAGLNPNLVYGSGADTLSASAGRVEQSGITPSKGTIDFIQKMSMLNAMKQQEANIDRTAADTNAVNANIGIAKAKLELDKKVTDARVKQINAETNLIDGRVDYRNPSTWKKYLDIINPVATAEKIGSVYQSLYDNVYGYMEARFGKRRK